MIIRSVAVWLLAAALFCATALSASAETWTSPGVYSITADGWTRSSASANDATFDCQRCGQRLFITIGYGPPNKPETGWTTNEGFIASVGGDQRRREFAKIYLDNWAQRGARYELLQVGLGPLDTLHALQFSARLTLNGHLIYMTHFQAVHKGRFLDINVMASGAMTAQSGAAVNRFFDNLKLLK
jgi:hypothetical protein